jgi:hypothetical protein
MRDTVDALRAAGELVSLRFRLEALIDVQPLDALLRSLGASRTRSHASFGRLERVLDGVESALAWLPFLPQTCLYRTLARYVVLRRRGWPVVFVLGLPADGSDRDGHAWLEIDDRPYREDDVSDMAVTFRFPAAPARP